MRLHFSTLLLCSYAALTTCHVLAPRDSTPTTNSFLIPTAGARVPVQVTTQISWFVNEASEPGPVSYNITLYRGSDIASKLEVDETDSEGEGTNSWIWFPSKSLLQGNDYTIRIEYGNLTLTSERFTIVNAATASTTTTSSGTGGAATSLSSSSSSSIGAAPTSNSSSGSSGSTSRPKKKKKSKGGLIGGVVGGVVGGLLILLGVGIWIWQKSRKDDKPAGSIEEPEKNMSLAGAEDGDAPPKVPTHTKPGLTEADGNERVEIGEGREKPVEMPSVRERVEMPA